MCVCIVLYVCYLADQPPGVVAHAIGYYLPVALLLWAIVAYVTMRGTSAAMKAIAFCVIYGCCVATSVARAEHDRRNSDIALASLKDEYASLLDNTADSEAITKPIAHLDTAPQASGMAGELERAVKEMMNEMITVHNDYIAGLSAGGWDNVLNPERIIADADMSGSHAIISHAREQIATCRAQSSRVFTKCRAKIETLRIGESARRSMLRGFDANVATSTATMAQLWDLEMRAADEIEKMVAILHRMPRAWSASGGQFTFERQEDLDGFNASAAQVQSIVKQQADIRAATAEKTKQSLNGLPSPR
jgi:hypothetical protein